MIDKLVYDNYVAILNNELRAALGCTEPIAVAFAAAKATELLGAMPQKIEIHCSGNVIKNVQGVTVPNSGGLKGVEAAAILGVLGGDASKELEVLEGITPTVIKKTSQMLGTDFCKRVLVENVSNLYLLAKVFVDERSAEVEIKDSHTNIVRMTVDNKDVFLQNNIQNQKHTTTDTASLNVKTILEFANIVELSVIQKVLENQIIMNTAISEEGLRKDYGVAVGRTLLDVFGNDIKIRAKANAAAGSDARMSGCSLPVIINSGSGNQGLTVSLPVIAYAQEMGLSREKLLRALVVSNLISLHQKKYIGKLSAYCGAVSAACGSGAAITYLHDGSYEDICKTIINTIANIGGMLCDGAKPSCAAKIASSVDAAIMAHHMSFNNKVFGFGEGLVQKDVEQTIENVGYVGRVGMKSTDIEILNIMLRS